eukprot:gene24101-biopygen14919
MPGYGLGTTWVPAGMPGYGLAKMPTRGGARGPTRSGIWFGISLKCQQGGAPGTPRNVAFLVFRFWMPSQYKKARLDDVWTGVAGQSQPTAPPPSQTGSSRVRSRRVVSIQTPVRSSGARSLRGALVGETAVRASGPHPARARFFEFHLHLIVWPAAGPHVRSASAAGSPCALCAGARTCGGGGLRRGHQQTASNIPSL